MKLIITACLVSLIVGVPSVIAQPLSRDLVSQGMPPAQALVLESPWQSPLRLGASVPYICTDTVDANDSKTLNLLSYGSTTGSGDPNRGSYFSIRGNEVATTGGHIQAVLGGTTSNFAIFGNSGSQTLLDIEDNGDLITFGTTITSNRTSDLGWAVVDGTDNTACTTQCTFAAVFGLNLSAGATAPNLVGPLDATADICMCAGAS